MWLPGLKKHHAAFDEVVAQLTVAGTEAVQEPSSQPHEVAPAETPSQAPAGTEDSGKVTIDASLLELFQEEVRTHVQTLNEGLVALEQQPANTELVDSLMRAAHSIKGAMRVVDVEAGVQVAHLVEDCLVAGEKGQPALGSEAIDVLLGAADLLASLAEAVGTGLTSFLASQSDTIASLTQALTSLVSDRSVAPSGSGAASRSPVVETPSDQAAPSEPASPSPEPDQAPSMPRAIPTASTPVPAEDEARSRVVRVTAENLTRLMSLAGESLVEARWLQPFANSLLALRRQQDRLADVLDELWQSQLADDVGQSQRATLADARGLLADCRSALAERIEEFETHARRSDDLNSRLYNEVIASRMRPFSDGVQGFARIVRDLSRRMGKSVSFQVRGEGTAVDRDVLEKLGSAAEPHLA